VPEKTDHTERFSKKFLLKQ